MNKYVWYSEEKNISSSDNVHQTLMFGNLDSIKELKTNVGENRLREIFLKNPKKIYTGAALNFIIKFILDIKNTIDEQKYLKSSPRNIR